MVASQEKNIPQSAQQNETLNFAGFAAEADYRRVNRELLQRVFKELSPNFTFVDVATGTGLVPQELKEMCRESGKPGYVIGVEPDPYAVKKARIDTLSISECRIEFVQGYGQDLPGIIKDLIPKKGADGISVHDALHEVANDEGKMQVLDGMSQSIEKGGLFSFNSAFTTISQTRPYGLWKLDVISADDRLKRDKSLEGFQALPPDWYLTAIDEVGIMVVHQDVKTVSLPQSAMIGISKYPRFIEGFFADIARAEELSLEEKSRMMIASLVRRDIQSMERVWFEVMGVKR